MHPAKYPGDNSRPIDVDDLADLCKVVARVGLDLLLGEPGAGLVAAAGVADQGGVIANDEDGFVA